VHHLNCGSLRPLGGRFVDGQPGQLRKARLVCHCLLLETGSGLVLVDTGFGTREVADPRLLGGIRPVIRPVLDLEETAARQVVRLGFTVEDVRHIVLTHLDLDHAGGLADFPHARVHLHAAELTAATGTLKPPDRLRYRAHQWAHGPDWELYGPSGEPWFGFEAARELKGLPSEILMIPLAGHSRGHSGVAIDTGDGWLLHAGDSYFFHGEMDPENRWCTPGLRLFQTIAQADRKARLGNQDRLLELARSHGNEVTLMSAHDETEFLRYAGTGS
jgi:glyoxylase-like metal-dependent hydrolase (beta-lactamase superfamily II)